MTEKLVYLDSYILTAEATILNVVEKDGLFEIELDRTPFFPEGGGQPSDTGFIDDIRVTHVYEQDDTIYHIVSERPSNTAVKCLVDRDRRIDHTQQHSGEHLLSAAFFKLFKVTNAGFHLGEEYVTVDIELPEISKEMLQTAEDQANQYVFNNEPITTYFLSKDEASKLPLRKEIKAEGNIRVVQMGENTDFSTCCGTHVKFTGEVGVIKITKAEKYKGMTRVYMKCGFRAIKDYQIKHSTITEIAKSFSVDTSEVVQKIKDQREELSALKAKISSLYSSIAETEATYLLSKASSKVIINEYEDETFDFLEKLYDKLKDEAYILILSSIKDKRLLLAHNGAFALDCGKLFKTELKAYNGRGGGNPKRAQANFETIEALKNFSSYLLSLELQ